MKPTYFLVGIVALLLVAVFWMMGLYNGLVSSSQAVDSQWAQVETQYQRRYDLIPNLVESTKGFLAQEKEILDNIAQARQGYAGASTPSDKAAAATQLESALSRLLVIVENYPQLKSNQTVQDLMVELAGTENRISVERKRYNDLVQSYNTQIKSFPTNLLAGNFGFSEKAYFQATTGADQPPRVDLTE